MSAPLIPLSDATLSRLPEGISVPRYDRKALTPGIVHIGLGNFHRAHQAWYLHRLMQEGLAHDWAIIGAGVRPYDEAMRAKLIAQDCLTTLITLDPDGASAEVIGSMVDYVPVEVGNEPLITRMTDPAIRIVSLTVTEGGYYIDPATHGFDANHPDIVHDAHNPDAPHTAFGAIVAALKRRRVDGVGPFAVQSCDNLQANGSLVRQTLVSLARLSDPRLADWIEESVSFPNAMVDCIVPATGDKERARVRSFGLSDAVPVAHESFRQWVMEDAFCAGRPPWDAAGATFTADVHAYETMKIRMLNGGHQLLANAGELLGLGTIADSMAHSGIRAFFQRVQCDEIVPHVAAVPDMTPAAYLDLITRRFDNPAIEDTVRRVAFDGSARHTGFLLPTVRDALRADGPIEGLALAEALWARMCFAIREDGSAIEANDPHWGPLTVSAVEARDRPRAWLEQEAFYGDLVHQARFADAFTRWLRLVWEDGTEAAITRYLDG